MGRHQPEAPARDPVKDPSLVLRAGIPALALWVRVSGLANTLALLPEDLFLELLGDRRRILVLLGAVDLRPLLLQFRIADEADGLRAIVLLAPILLFLEVLDQVPVAEGAVGLRDAVFLAPPALVLGWWILCL